MTRLQKQLIEIYEASGYSAVLDFWKKNEDSIKHLSQNEISILKNTMSRYCMIHNDEKVSEIISLEDKQQFLHNNAIMELLFKFGKYYYDGVNLNPSLVQSEEIYEMILELGNSNDLYRLGDNYYSGNSINQSYEKAFECFQKSAMKGNKLAQYRLGEMYMQGKGVTKSKEEAIKWYKISNETLNSYKLSTMIIPDGIVRIGDNSFEEFENLTKVVIPNTVICIQEHAFKNCKNLKEVIFQNNTIAIGSEAFIGCENLSQNTLSFIRNLDYELIKMPIRTLSVSKFKVTQKIYEKVMGENPSYFKGQNHPVEGVSIFDAIYFCNKMSICEGLKPVYSVDGFTDVSCWKYSPHKEQWIHNISQNINADGYRLPTREEWEYAAKGGEEWKYAGSSDIFETSWFCENSEHSTHEVGLKEPNLYGLYDICGNVCEWCFDVNQDDNNRYCLSGGSYSDNSSICNIFNKRYKNGCRTSSRFGFRIVRTVN